jgi:hypothetical protein
MYAYILVIVFLAIAIAPQLLAVWYIKWENKKETIAEQFAKEMISAIDDILFQRPLQEKIKHFVKVGFPTPNVIDIGQNDVDYYDGIDNYTFTNEEEINDLDFYAESLNHEIERSSWDGSTDRDGIRRHNGNIKCGIQLYHDGRYVSHNKGTWARSHGLRGNKPKTHK